MSLQNSTTGNDQKKERSPGPATVGKVQDRLETLAAFAYLGKRAYMDGGYDDEGWEKFLSTINSPFAEEHLRERAFEELLKIACEAWTELSFPKDAVEGQLIDRTKQEEPQAPEPESE